MINKFLDQLNTIISKLPENKVKILINNIFIKHKNQVEFSNYLTEVSCSEFIENFIQEFPDELEEKFNNYQLNNFNGILGLIKAASALTNLSKGKIIAEKDKRIFARFYLLTIIQKEFFNTITSKEELLIKIKFSQSDIAKGFEVDNDTLSKWFEIIYGKNIYFGRKKISLGEYLKIFNDLFLESNEVFDVKNRLRDFLNRVENGKTYSKKDVIEFGFELDKEPTSFDYSEAKNILLKDFPFYEKIDKYPYNIALKMINFLQGKY
jgi:hypothetical protein